MFYFCESYDMEGVRMRAAWELVWLYAVVSCVKLLVVPSYHSTDLEVHRNWLAITHSLPLSEWYSDETSPWTLDYPPFFAYFQLLLSLFAHLVDPKIVHLFHGLDYKANSVIYFQRISVILSDLLLLFGIYSITITNKLKFDPLKRKLIWIFLVCSPALFIVDHLHFQYNGFLLGWLLLSISCLLQGRDLMGGFLFSVLLCFKHLFAVAAPVFFVYLLRHYCRGGFLKGFGRLSLMGAVVVAVFSAAFGPFVYHGQIRQILRRMFPFGRGLCHAYWAPNFWVFYILLDKALAVLLRKLGLSIQTPAASFTGGLVGDSSPFAVLPQVTPLITFITVLLALSPCLIKAWKLPQPRMIARWIAYAYTCGFMFGWHVHEKASLHFVIPLAIVAVDSLEDAKHYFLLSVVSCYSLFPLLYEAREYPIKVLLLVLHSLLMWFGFSVKFPEISAAKASAVETKKGGKVRPERSSGGAASRQNFALGWVMKTYLLGLVVVEVWGQFLHQFFLGNKLPFVPLMLISIYCAFGITYSWIWQLRCILKSS